jgi:Brp/Blh family beta-carotene 15,15'-monooxygenase
MSCFFQWVPLAPPSGVIAQPNLDRLATAGAALVVGVAALILFFDAGGGAWELVPLALSAVLFGLPHGAVDHLVLLGLARRRLTFGNLLWVCGLYLAAVGLVLLLWWALPRFALIFFLSYTIYHWGKADLAFEAVRSGSGDKIHLGPKNLCHLLLRGLLPIGLPFVAFPQETGRFLNRCLDAFESQLAISGSLPLYLGLGIGLLLLTEIAYCFRSEDGLRIALETVSLSCFFLLVPPLLAIGLYFCGWHGLRHVLRILNYGPYEAAVSSREKLDHSFGRFFIRAAPFTFLSLLMLWGLRELAAPSADLPETTAIYLVLISSLTLPHILVVEWMDRQEFEAGLGRKQHH